MRPIVTLLSDWRTRDPYVAMFKGALLTAVPEVEIIDITHVVDLYNLQQAAFLTQQSYRSFPEGSVHLLLAGTSHAAKAKAAPICVQYDNHFFIGEDNGIFFMMFNRDFPVVARQYAGNETNMTDQLVQLVKAVCDNKLESQTIAYDNFKRQFAALPIHFPSTKTIEGEIVYIDAYYNAITNIPIDMFKEAVHDGPFQAIISSKKDWQCQVYHDNYQPDEEIYLTQNALGCLEITLYQGAVSVLADLKVGDKITIKY